MPALQVKDCPATVYDRLRECASRENRSISQQVLTIIESYLGMREQSASTSIPEIWSASSASWQTEINIQRRNWALKQIAKLKPLPVTEKSPDSATLLAQARGDALHNGQETHATLCEPRH